MKTDAPAGSWPPEPASSDAELLSLALGRVLQLAPAEVTVLRRYLERIDHIDHLLRTLHAGSRDTAGRGDVHEGPDKRWREQHGPRADPTDA